MGCHAATRARLFVVAGLVFVAGCSQSDAQPTRFGGVWTLAFGKRTFAVLALTQRGDRVTGSLTLPSHFEVGQPGFRFTNISADAAPRPISQVSIQNDRLHFVTVNPKNTQDTDALDLTVTGADTAVLKLADAPFEPWMLKRLPRGAIARVSTDWDPLRSYSEEDGLPSSAEMEKIFEADQNLRQNWQSLSNQEREAIGAGDAGRRLQTRKLLAGGRLHTGEDFKRAAFIFQHGSTPDDYMLAHTLAMVAVANGDASALWIATATLDRYLQSVGKSQVYGTQFTFGERQPATQEPYSRELISDALRRQLGVPSLADQQKQLAEMSRETK
jgi:hypothetical protein